MEQYIPTINHDGRFELYVAPTIQLEEQIEGGEINDISIIGLDLDLFVIGDPLPSAVNEGLFGITYEGLL